ncbi:hypothetical protein [Aestuariirhabdus litorea]|uniref:Uncharacterized protein n=1 Tax=Aestuariirhabdus litorea TaxID=2528527 RepID=A0A3P3VU43_9GAMM|nr:hypothetical protein [Aestuariirhabdus litorea]RRJ85136.1 hypothetical protein D0544_08735 [Aestuariirhabdus litorea]RWW98359.1 hypothetical protein DZC74_08725 [Endozoicomonadaceae bacterium GTF-13]
MNKQQLRLHLLRMAQNPQHSFQIFVAGVFLFSVGVGAILYAEHRLAPSVSRELLASLGMLIAGAGVVVTLSGYLRLCAGRVLKLFFGD